MNVSKEQLILACTYVIAIAGFIYLYRKRPFQARMVFLFHQMLTWILGIAVVQAGLIVYPVRELPHATRTSFVYEFLAFPVVACYFIAYFPSESRSWKKVLYTLAYPTALTIPEYVLERHTLTIQYVHWSWYCTFISVLLTLLLTRLLYRKYMAIWSPTLD